MKDITQVYSELTIKAVEASRENKHMLKPGVPMEDPSAYREWTDNAAIAQMAFGLSGIAPGTDDKFERWQAKAGLAFAGKHNDMPVRIPALMSDTGVAVLANPIDTITDEGIPSHLVDDDSKRHLEPEHRLPMLMNHTAKKYTTAELDKAYTYLETCLSCVSIVVGHTPAEKKRFHYLKSKVFIKAFSGKCDDKATCSLWSMEHALNVQARFVL